MRRHVTGLILALILLALAVPASLGCCFGPPNAGPHAHVASPAVVRADAVVAQPASFEQDNDTAVHDCIDRSAPAQTPYIETGNGSGGRGIATSRASAAAVDLPVTSSVATAPVVRRYSVAANDTGPPLWLSTCVSRT
jgi:hypothetical protein